jgi:hypothetical protein
MRPRFMLALLGMLAALALTSVPAASAATDVHLATLHGSASFPNVTGKAKFSRDDGVRQLEAQIEDAHALAGMRVRFRVNGDLVATATVGPMGTARINRAGNSVPVVSTGSTIRVRTSNGTLVAAGRFS